jgi:broad specificity phosphatase PhoE
VLTILLTRHGQTEAWDPERYLGQNWPVDLSERGRRDAVALGERLKSVPIDRVISSPLPRAQDTARLIVGERPLEIEIDRRIIEFDYGTWEGMSTPEIKEKLTHEYELYEANPAIFEVGGGESGLEAAQRVVGLIDDMLAWWGGSADRTVLLVGHSSINRALLAAVTNVPMADYRRRFQQDWANLTVLRWASLLSGPLLVLVNDVAHVRGVGGVTWD